MQEETNRNFLKRLKMQVRKTKLNLLVSVRFGLLIVLTILISSGCGIKKYVGPEYTKSLDLKEVGKRNEVNQDKLNTIWIKKIRGVYFYGDEERKFNSNIRIIKDSIIIISIGMDFGIEAIRAYIKKDSIIIINRFNKTWYAGKIADLSNRYELINSYKRIEEILLMNVGKTTLLELDKSVNVFKGEVDYCYRSVNKEGNSDFVEKVCFDSLVGYIRERVITTGNIKSELQILYSEYKDVNSCVLPTEIDIGLRNAGNEYSILLYYDKWVLNEKFSTKMKLGESYRRVNGLLDL